MLSVLSEYRVVEDSGTRRTFSVQITGYRYEILDSAGDEILAYHYHPSGVSNVRYPHLHVSGKSPAVDIGRGMEQLSLDAMHLHTGQISIEDVVQLVIREFGVQPLKPDWERVLDANRAAMSLDQF